MTNHKKTKKVLKKQLTPSQRFGSLLMPLAACLAIAGLIYTVWTFQSAHAAKPRAIKYSISITDIGFRPSTMQGETGVPIKIHVKNLGTKEHNFVLPGYFIFSPNLHAGESTDIEFTPDKKGIFPFYSDTPGNPEPGLQGRLTVR
ncbi:cupredoxin domain-containing protein [Fodinisporobacter ferrooxydans]|uniref:Cupredoxin domain-containing protein n=1 Tax=Fodinisporobacter ferrooxydans TaxID=2901836 RepID=A0ABY4CJ28_9BACL|nr:cupredoxin domain-containing protein [Alicyclobacillaceae bacterium MYW30-H2]